MGFLIFLALLALLVSPFALAGFWRAWRGALVVWLPVALYTVLVWSSPMPPYYDEQDQLGAGAWQMILLVLVTGGALAFATGFLVSAVRTRKLRERYD